MGQTVSPEVVVCGTRFVVGGLLSVVELRIELELFMGL